MWVRVMGCHGPYPGANGACSGYLVHTGTARLMLDLGPGTLGRLMAVMDPGELDGLLFSHFHEDHCSDLGALRYYLNQWGQGPLKVFGPEAGRTRFEGDHRFCYQGLTPGIKVTIGQTQITALPARHPVEALGYRIDTTGHAMVYTGDTNTLPELAALYKGADLLLADGCLDHEAWREESPHLSAYLAGEIASQAQVKQLVVTHLCPARDSLSLIKQARRAYPQAVLAKMDACYEW